MTGMYVGLGLNFLLAVGFFAWVVTRPRGETKSSQLELDLEAGDSNDRGAGR